MHGIHLLLPVEIDEDLWRSGWESVSVCRDVFNQFSVFLC